MDLVDKFDIKCLAISKEIDLPSNDIPISDSNVDNDFSERLKVQ